MGEKFQESLKLQFDKRLKLEFQGAKIGRRALEKQAAGTNTLSRFETEVLITGENEKGLEQLNAAWVDRALTRTRHQRIILDLDSSESPLYGEQEGAAYNGHFGCLCYHPLFCFNQFGDCEGNMLRPGNVHSAECWRGILEPIVERYQKRGVRLVFRADAAFARPELHFYNKRGTAEQWIKEGKYTLNWTRLSCHRFVANQLRLQLFILAYNLGNFLRRLVLPGPIKDWPLRSLQAKLIKMGGRVRRGH